MEILTLQMNPQFWVCKIHSSEMNLFMLDEMINSGTYAATSDNAIGNTTQVITCT